MRWYDIRRSCGGRITYWQHVDHRPRLRERELPCEYPWAGVGLFQEFLVIGSMFACWLDYAVSLHIPASTKQWRSLLS